jgi:hypothetical protein
LRPAISREGPGGIGGDPAPDEAKGLVIEYASTICLMVTQDHGYRSIRRTPGIDEVLGFVLRLRSKAPAKIFAAGDVGHLPQSTSNSAQAFSRVLYMRGMLSFQQHAP